MTNVPHLKSKQKTLQFYNVCTYHHMSCKCHWLQLIFFSLFTIEGDIKNVISVVWLILSVVLPGILLRHYRKLRNLSRFLSSANVSLTARLGLARHADYLCDLHCFSHSLVLFCSLFGIFTLVLIHNEYRRGCNINKAQSLGRWVYLRIQIKRTMEVTESLHIDLMFSFMCIIYNADKMPQVWYPNYRGCIN